MNKQQDNLTRFTKAVEHWCAAFGLKDWAVTVYKDSLGPEGPQARVHLGWEDKYADVIWNSDNATDLPESMSPERLALHEVLHILLCDVVKSPKEATNANVHAAINRLVRVLMPVGNGILDNSED